jgi:capsular polysaccharide biosynthesis protein
MRPLIRFFSKLYPPQWRQRYGAEFDALLDDVEPNAKTALNVISGATFMQIRTWNVGTILAAGGLAGVLFGLGITTTIPKLYESRSTLALSSPVSQDTRDGINLMANEALSRSSLTRMVSTLGLYPQERAKMPIEDVLDGIMKRNIAITPVNNSSGTVAAFSIAFIYSDPAMAQKVTQTLAARFIDANLHQPAGTLKLLDMASLPSQPVAPRPSRNALMGMGWGLALGAIVAFFHRRRGAART